MKMTMRSCTLATVFLFACLPTAEESSGNIHNAGSKYFGVGAADNDRKADSDSALVIGIASLTPDDGTEVDDGDNNPDTRRYFLFRADSGRVIVRAVPTPQVGEDDLPGSWSLEGGIGTSKLLRMVDRTVAGTTVITCYSGTAMKRVTLHVLDVGVSSVGFTGDHLIRKWPDGPDIDPNDDTPVWGGGHSDPVCYTKNTPVNMFATFTVSPDPGPPALPGVHVRARVGAIIVGSASQCEVEGTWLQTSGSHGVVDGIRGGYPIPGSDGVRVLTPSLAWEVSTNGSDWSPAGSLGGTMYITDSTPSASPLWDFGLAKACGYVSGSPDIGGSINSGLAAELYYRTCGCTFHDLHIFDWGYGQCCCHAAVFSLLVSHVGSVNPSPVFLWGGCSPTCECCYTYEDWVYGPTFQCEALPQGSAPANPHFRFHVEVSYAGTYYDPSYGVTGLRDFLETAPACEGHPVAATRQTGSDLPSHEHDVAWQSPY